jgi:hypothetical protein
VRVLFAGDHFENDFFETDDPGSLGIVGGSPETDQIVTLELSPATSAEDFNGNGEMQQGHLHLPVFDDSVFGSYTSTGYESPLGPLTGTVYAGVDKFAAYLLGVNGDHAHPFYAVTGTPTDVPAVFAEPMGNDVRQYTFTQDPLQAIAVPFMQAGVIDDLSNAAVTDFFVVEPTEIEETPVVFQAWLSINGAGANQESAIGVTAADMFIDSEAGTYAIRTGRAGSYREEGTVPSVHMYGGVRTVDGPTGDSIFGANGENFVISTSVSEADVFGDTPALPAADNEHFSTIHVANLQEEIPLSEFTRSTRTLTGFATGVAEVANTTSITGVGHMMSSADGQGFQLRLDAETNRVGAEIAVSESLFDATDIDSLFVTAGVSLDGEEYGQSAYVDDNMFAATDNFDESRTFATDDSQTVLPQRTGLTPANYVVSSDAVPQTGYMGDGTVQCTCSFLEWGWWGTQMQSATAGDPQTETSRESVHLGTWVAGDIVDNADLPAIGSATYAGHAVGTVLSGGAQYVAGGGMDMSWDFGAREGRVDVTNFDNHDFGWDVAGTGGATDPALFSGTFTEMGGGGAVNGAFVANGADNFAGVIGNFGVVDGGWSASGIIAGERTSFDPEGGIVRNR